MENTVFPLPDTHFPKENVYTKNGYKVRENHLAWQEGKGQFFKMTK